MRIAFEKSTKRVKFDTSNSAFNPSRIGMVDMGSNHETSDLLSNA